MKPRSLVRVFAVCVSSAVLAGISLAQDPTEGQADMMKRMQQMGAPGEAHKVLDHQAGNWEFTAKVWGPMGGEPTESTGTIEASWIMGGRFLKQEITTTFMDMPIQGVSIDGYDNLAKEYIGIWMDNMGTGIMYFEGSCDAAGKVRTMFAESPNPMNPDQTQETKGVTKIIDDDHFSYEQYMVLPDGTEFKQMDLRATRRK
jgi:hypothetical protein